MVAYSDNHSMDPVCLSFFIDQKTVLKRSGHFGFKPGKTRKLPFFTKKRESYFLRITAAARRVTPNTARMGAIPTGDFCVTPAAAGAAGIAAETGACAGAIVAADVAAEDPSWWIQWYCTIASALCPQMVLLHISYPFTPHWAIAVLSPIHWHGAVQTGAFTPDVSWVSAIIPIPAALTGPDITAAIPRITMILTYRFHIIPYHQYKSMPPGAGDSINLSGYCKNWTDNSSKK